MRGGAGTHFSRAASLFAHVRGVGIVGEDFGEEEAGVLPRRGMDTEDLERVAGSTFFWRGRYDFDLNTAQTLDTPLNVFAGFQPKLAEGSKAAGALFLGNIQPGLQAAARAGDGGGGPVGLDPMNPRVDTPRDGRLDR